MRPSGWAGQRNLQSESCANPEPEFLKIRSVLFVDQTKDGKLMKDIKEVERDW